ncbi:MAG: enoyl-CoA hydratase/isomerase family protein [Clostridia bacterium]|nr:enoyl-CoA hydratase/isomerase family protein [Clostridia bacterium]
MAGWVRIERDTGTAVVVIDRQDALNAFNRDVLQELRDVLVALAEDGELRAVIVTGAGERAFAAGADIKAMADMGPEEALAFSRLGHEVMRRVETLPVPVIAAVNGVALGGGCELALACDFRIASERARFGLPEVGLGLLPGWGGTQRLARLVGPGWARQMTFTGEPVTAAQALAIGLVNEVVPPEQLLSRVRAIAASIAARGPVAVRRAKEAMVRGADMDLESGTALEAALFAILFATEDSREGIRAFLEKRAPVFRGR